MKGLRLRKIENEEDLKEIGYDYLADIADEIEGHYLDEEEEEFTPKKEGGSIVRKEITFITIVNDRPYPTKYRAVVSQDGKLYIPEDEYESVL